MSRFDSWHRKISTGRHFQNGHHNTAQIQHCPISSKFDMWGLENKLKTTFEIEQCWIFAALWRPFWKWRLVEIFQCRQSIQDVEINTVHIQHCPISMPFHMWVDYDVPIWFLTSKNFYRSPFSKWPPQYRTNSTLSDIIKIWYVGERE
jgi:hypothetical protein